ncbi:RNaseH [Bacillus phage vB_BceM-HSE3]|nr:RNaseH [Bacillus phage vB_BceM-HSE3]
MMHRSLKVPDLYNLRASDGHRTGGIMGFTRMLNATMNKFPDYMPINCLDSGLSPRRLEAYPNYKHHADKKSEREMRASLLQMGVKLSQEELESDEYVEEYRTQRAHVVDILDCLGIPSLNFQNWEGDDLMDYLSRNCEESIVVTDDRDLLQLLSPNVSVYRPMADEFWTHDEYLKANEFNHIEETIFHKAIVGDGSDNIPAVTAGLERKHGVGGKRANVIAKVIHFNPTNYLDILQEMSEDAKAYRDLYGKIPVNPIKGFIQRHDHFLRNMELVDLRRNEFPDEIVTQINSTITAQSGKIDYFGAVGHVGKHEIKKFDIDSVVAKVNMLSLNFN